MYDTWLVYSHGDYRTPQEDAEICDMVDFNQQDV